MQKVANLKQKLAQNIKKFGQKGAQNLPKKPWRRILIKNFTNRILLQGSFLVKAENKSTNIGKIVLEQARHRFFFMRAKTSDKGGAWNPASCVRLLYLDRGFNQSAISAVIVSLTSGFIWSTNFISEWEQLISLKIKKCSYFEWIKQIFINLYLKIQ